MEGTLTKKEFMKSKGYSESTYHRRMKLFRNSKFREGYIAPTKNEVYIDTELYDQFLKEESEKRFEYQII
ncbi:hypothetical protein [Enterococcus malodoratus]|uniref:hypothetical protein n=1 Tax=Enterococcus malodoratus TaxID=71451 RepID=UPI0020737BC5|nr:hypothetical protein [Enterococcus malodoratus]